MADRQIGILGMEVYFPTTFVEQADLGASLLTMNGKRLWGADECAACVAQRNTTA